MKLTHILTAAAAAGCALLLAACQPGGSDAPADYPVHLAGTVIDQRPERVVSLAPAITDMLYQLQIPGQLVAVSDYCELPPPTGREVAYDYPRAGTQQLPDLDTIVELDADLVLMTAEPTEDTANALLQADIDYLVLSPAADMDGVRENFVTLCKALYGDTTGAELASRRLTGYDHKYQRILDCLGDAAAAGEGPSTVYLAGDILQMATGDSFEGYLLTFLGTDNWGDEYTNYSFPAEREIELNPDVIFYNGMMSREAIAGSTCYATTTAGSAGTIYYIDPENFERQTPDIVDTLWEMGEFLYPESFVAEEPGQPWESSEASYGYIPDTAGPETETNTETDTESALESSSEA